MNCKPNRAFRLNPGFFELALRASGGVQAWLTAAAFYAARALLGQLDLGHRDQDLGAGLEIGRFEERLLLRAP